MSLAHDLQVLNKIGFGLHVEHSLAESRPLREILGHTPLQVGQENLDIFRFKILSLISYQLYNCEAEI